MSVTIEKQSCFAEGPFWNRNVDKPPEKKRTEVCHERDKEYSCILGNNRLKDFCDNPGKGIGSG